MRFALLLSAALVTIAATPALAELKLENIQACYGRLGPERTSLELLPFDELIFRFDVVGVTLDEEGNTDGTVGVKLTDAEGNSLLEVNNPLKGIVALGGNRLPATASVQFNDAIPEGEYVLTASFTDKLSKETASFERKLVAKPTGLAIVAPQFFYDAEGSVPAPVGGLVGQSLHFRFKGAGFDRSQGKIDLVMTVQVLDGEGKELMKKPLTVPFQESKKEVVEKAQVLSFNGFLALNRAGEFTLRLRLEDQASGKSTEFKAPLIVREP